MKKGWVEVSLGEVLRPRFEYQPLNPDREYKEVTVSLWGKGVRLRRKVLGSEISATERNIARTGDFIISKIDARHGAYGFIPDSLEGGIVTNDFPLFEIAVEKLHPRWLYWVSKSRFFVELCRRASEGTTNRVRLKETKFSALGIPLPPMAEQQRIVAHLDALEGRLIHVQKLREEQENQLCAALRSAFHRIEKKSTWLEIGEVAPLYRRPIDIEPYGKYPQLGARSFGKGIFHKPTLNGAELTWQKLFLVHAGDIVISNIKAWEGAIAVARESDHGRYGSHRYLTCVVDQKRAMPEFICFYLLTRDGLEKIGKASPGSADRNRTLSTKRLERVTVPVPSMDLQREFRKLLALQQSIRQEAQRTKERLESLLPSVLDRIFNRELNAEGVRVSQVAQLGLPGFSPDIIDASGLLRQKAALSAYFVHKSGQDKYRGRVKMEKFDQFVEAHCGLDLGRNPQALAAGPADMASREAVEKEAQKNDWYSVQRFNDSNSRTHYEYFAGKNIPEAISIAEQFMGDRKAAVDRLIKLLKPLNTHQCSIIATLHSAWSSLLKIQTPVSDDRIVSASVHSHPEKQKISMVDWNWGLGWLRTNEFVPKI